MGERYVSLEGFDQPDVLGPDDALLFEEELFLAEARARFTAIKKIAENDEFFAGQWVVRLASHEHLFAFRGQLLDHTRVIGLSLWNVGGDRGPARGLVQK